MEPATPPTTPQGHHHHEDVSKDAGSTWTDYPVPDLSIYALAGTDGAVWAGTETGLKRTTDYGTWSDAGAGRFTGLVSSLAASRDGRVVLAGTADGSSGSTFRSLDGGKTWGQLAPGPLRNAAAPVMFAVDTHESSHLFASTAAGTIMESTDTGATWNTIRSG